MAYDFEAPPMSADNLPLKELKPEPEIKDIAAEKIAKNPLNNKMKLFLGLMMALILLIGIAVGISFRGKAQKEIVKPSPSPLSTSPSPTSSLMPELTLKGRIDVLGKNLRDIDLKETNLIPPILDFKLRFEAKK